MNPTRAADVFLKTFNKVKKYYRPKARGSQTLSTKSKNNLKKLVARGYEEEDFRKATIAMYKLSNGWAESTGNDTPDHLLVETNFDRYLNLFESNEEREAEKKAAAIEKKEEKVKIKAPEHKEVQDEKKRNKEWDKEALAYWKKSVEAKEWLGTQFHASTLCEMMKDRVKFSPEEIAEIESEAEKLSKESTYKGVMSVRHRIVSDLKVIKALKRYI
jgi:hypothetical protein